MTSLISAVSWIPRGAAAQHPKKYVVDEAELERVGQLAKIRLEDAQMELEMARAQEGSGMADEEEEEEGMEGEGDGWEDTNSNEDVAMDEDALMGDADQAAAAAKAAAKKIKAANKGSAKAGGKEDPEDLSAYNLDEYDEEESKGAAMGAFSNIKGLSYYGDNKDDPYVTMEAKQEDEALEREELEIYPTDNLLVVAKTQDDVSQLEVYVYDETEENLYVHHDLLLPAMPICLEWMDYCPGRTNEEGQRGNYVAVGTLDPEIEIWSLDVVDGLYPDAILGPPTKNSLPLPSVPTSSITESTSPSSESTTGKKKKKKKKAKKPIVVANDAYHVDSILSLSWNRSHRNLLASSSADKTIKLWDLSSPLLPPPFAPTTTLIPTKFNPFNGTPRSRPYSSPDHGTVPFESSIREVPMEE